MSENPNTKILAKCVQISERKKYIIPDGITLHNV